MKSIQFLGNGVISIEEVSNPAPEGNNVVVRIKASGICGTDRYALLEDGQDTIPGHEIAGEIVEIDKPSWARVGDRVAINCHISCRRCEHCLRGDFFFCDQLQVPGFDWDGGFAEYLLIPEDNCHPLPDDISFETGALIVDVFGTAFRGVKRAGILPGNQIAVWGAGPIGLEVLALAEYFGARVAILDTNEYRLKMAEAIYHPELILDSKKGHIEEQINEWTNGRGLDVAFECAGKEKASQQALRTIKKRGLLSIIGVSHSLNIDPWDLIQKELMISASRNFNTHEFNEMVAVVRSGFTADNVITHRFEVNDARKAIDVFLSGECGKVIFTD